MCSFTRKSGFALGITFFGLSVLVGALPIACRTPPKKITTDEFFESLLVGGAHNGKIYIELSLTPELFSKTKTREDRWAVWEAFFKKAILEQPPAADSQKFDIAPYWGEYVFGKEKIDRAYIAKSVNLQVGDQILSVLSVAAKRKFQNGEFMKKAKNRRLATATDDMLPEYDFQGKKGVRGKYFRAYRQGHTVRIYDTDGTVSVRHFTLADGAVMLEPDVRVYFPNSDAVNKILRSLIALVPAKSTRRRLSRSA